MMMKKIALLLKEAAGRKKVGAARLVENAGMIIDYHFGWSGEKVKNKSL